MLLIRGAKLRIPSEEPMPKTRLGIYAKEVVMLSRPKDRLSTFLKESPQSMLTIKMMLVVL
jgi:hypothetical protein